MISGVEKGDVLGWTLSSTGPMDPLIIKYNHMINPPKKFNILCESLIVYNVICHDYTSKFHTKIILHVTTTMYTWIYYMIKERLFVYIYHMVLYNPINGYHPCFIWSCTYTTILTTKISPRAHHTRINPRTKLNMKILLYTLTHKILPNSLHTSLC